MHKHYYPYDKSAADIKRDIELFKRFSNESNSIKSIRTRGVLNWNYRKATWHDAVLTLAIWSINAAIVSTIIYIVWTA